MSDLLSHAEYLAIANDIKYPSTAFIDGKFQRTNGEKMPTINPATNAELSVISCCNEADVDIAVSRAKDAFNSGVWSHMHPSARKDILIKLCKLITRNRHELAVLESLDSGKPIRDCALIDIPETIHCIKWYAEAIDKLYDKTAPVGDDAMAMIVREPVGVVAAILPWNFPLMMLAWKIAPALAAGNAVIVKPAEQTSLSALRLAELAMEAGLPRAILQILPGSGPIVGKALGLHHDVDMVTFTGSTETGRHFLHYAADSNMKRVTLECGGKNPAIVTKDAGNLDIVASHIVNGAFWNMGENCSATSRLIVDASVKDELLTHIKARLREWKMGDPLDPQNHLGCLIDTAHHAKVTSYLNKGTIFCGGDVQGNFVAPTIFDNVSNDDILAQDEIFGPILSVITVKSLEEAIDVANKTAYGLTAALYCTHAKKAMRAAKQIKAGTVTINCFGEGDITTPFGGYKQSGFGGRDNGVHAFEQYCEVKTIWLDLSDNDKEDDIT